MDSADPAELIRRADAALADIGKLRAEIADRIHAGTDEVVTRTLQNAPLEHVRPYLARGARLGDWPTPSTAPSPTSTACPPGC